MAAVAAGAGALAAVAAGAWALAAVAAGAWALAAVAAVAGAVAAVAVAARAVTSRTRTPITYPHRYRPPWPPRTMCPTSRVPPSAWRPT